MNYFDHAASTPLYPQVLDTLYSSMSSDFANPGALHVLGTTLAENISIYKESFFKNIGASRFDSFIFTSSATESNNTVIRGLSFEEGDVIVYCLADHPSVTAPIENLKGVNLKNIVLNNDGSIDIESFKKIIDEKVKLVVLTSVNNQSGVINDIRLMSSIIKLQSHAHVHVDAVQSFGKIDLNLSADIDSVSLTSHKIGGPKGVAGLFLKKGHHVKPLLIGGGQEDGLRSSTQAYPLIKSFHLAMTLTTSGQKNSYDRVFEYSEIIKKHLKKTIPTTIFPFLNSSPYIVSFILPGISSDIILRHLEVRKVYISSTAACSSRLSGVNSTLSAMNISKCYHKNFLRISLGPQSTLEEVGNLLNEFVAVWESVKHMQKR